MRARGDVHEAARFCWPSRQRGGDVFISLAARRPRATARENPADWLALWIGASTAGFVDKILKGAKTGDLPFEQPDRFFFTLNLKAAKAIGLNLP